MVEYRYLGNSGFKVSEITYGNWVTHASQVENDAAIATVHKALDLGITSFDTADAYANTAAEVVLGEALKGQPRETLEIFTKVYWPTGRKGPNDQGLSRKHIFDSINGSLRRLGVDYVDLYQAHRYDYETPLEETMQAFADIVRQGKALYIGVSEWTAEQLREGHALAKQLGFQLVSNQPQYSALWRVIEGKVIPASQELGISQIVWSPLAQGVLTGKYQPGQPVPEGSRATDEKSGAPRPRRPLHLELAEHRIRDVEVRRIDDEDRDALARRVRERTELGVLAAGRLEPELLAELTTRGIQRRLTVRVELAFDDRPGTLVLGRPVGPAHMRDERRHRAVRSDAVGQDAGARRGHDRAGSSRIRPGASSARRCRSRPGRSPRRRRGRR